MEGIPTNKIDASILKNAGERRNSPRHLGYWLSSKLRMRLPSSAVSTTVKGTTTMSAHVAVACITMPHIAVTPAAVIAEA